MTYSEFTQIESAPNGLNGKSNAAQGILDLLVDGLKDIYWAEKELIITFPKMIKNSTSEELAEALKNHLEETSNQVIRLDKVFKYLGEKPDTRKYEAITELIIEAEDIMVETEPGVVRDAGIISVVQKVAHYEMATYRTLASFARILGEDKAADLLEETLGEEKAADQKLSEISDIIIFDALNEDQD